MPLRDKIQIVQLVLSKVAEAQQANSQQQQKGVDEELSFKVLCQFFLEVSQEWCNILSQRNGMKGGSNQHFKNRGRPPLQFEDYEGYSDDESGEDQPVSQEENTLEDDEATAQIRAQQCEIFKLSF